MTDDEAHAALLQILDSHRWHGEPGAPEPEMTHTLADSLLCCLLRNSHPKTVAEFEKMDKWYS